ncbi:MAG: sulfotransferase [Deltaproteobacteria bacterium]|nr:sulfotransferase [Deltaproteobacteria bacterium]
MIAQLDGLYIRTRPTKAVSRLVSYALFEGRPLTTRGRWINPLVFALYSLEKRLPAVKKVEMPIFILGTGRSGTTILGVVLSMHRDVAFLNEPKALWHSLYNEEDIIGGYTKGPARYRLGADDAGKDVIKNAHRLYGAYLAATFSKRVVDKYPELIFRVQFVKAIFPDAKFLFLARSGWDTCRSIDTWSKRLGENVKGEVHDWWGVNDRKWRLLIEQVACEDPDLCGSVAELKALTGHADRAAVEWALTMREGIKLLKSDPAVMLVRYESLVEDPKKSLAGILKFCGLRNDGKFLGYAYKTLVPAARKKPFDLHPLVRSVFEKTMKEMGYE